MVNHIAAQTMVMVAASSIILGTAGYVLTPHLLELLGVATDVYQGALGFMRLAPSLFVIGKTDRNCAGTGSHRLVWPPPDLAAASVAAQPQPLEAVVGL